MSSACGRPQAAPRSREVGDERAVRRRQPRRRRFEVRARDGEAVDVDDIAGRSRRVAPPVVHRCPVDQHPARLERSQWSPSHGVVVTRGRWSTKRLAGLVARVRGRPVLQCLDNSTRDEGNAHMTAGRHIAMLGTGLIGDFYTMTLHGGRSRDRVAVVYSRSIERGESFQQRWDVPACDDEHRRCRRPPRRRHRGDRPAQPHARGGRRRGRRRRQGGAVHQAARPHRRRGAADRRARRGRPACSAATSKTWCTRPRR